MSQHTNPIERVGLFVLAFTACAPPAPAEHVAPPESPPADAPMSPALREAQRHLAPRTRIDPDHEAPCLPPYSRPYRLVLSTRETGDDIRRIMEALAQPEGGAPCVLAPAGPPTVPNIEPWCCRF